MLSIALEEWGNHWLRYAAPRTNSESIYEKQLRFETKVKMKNQLRFEDREVCRHFVVAACYVYKLKTWYKKTEAV